MSDLIDDAPEGVNAPEFTVSELSGAVKRVVEGEFGHVRVRGEVGRVSRPRSGHVYLDLKDDRAVLSGVIWRGVATRLTQQPEEGLEVVATGRLTTFPGQSRYQIVIDDIRPAGVGALMAMLEKRRKALAAEGLFDATRKRPLPYLPGVIGVVTSPSGAVIRDILHRLRERFPRQVLIWPVAVQGESCGPEVARAVRGFNALAKGGAVPRPDLLIVARGGGSVEDLWGFNDEGVVRAVADSAIPVISAVGHETDTTLIDHAADRRAPTPSAAAEIAVPVRMDLLAWADGQEARLSAALNALVAARGQRLRDLARALPRPERLLDTPRQRLDRAGERLPEALGRTVQLRRVALSDRAGALRPSLIRRALAAEARRLSGLAVRLSPDTLRRPIARRQEAAGVLTQRLAQAARHRTGALRDRLEALERVRQTMGYEATLRRGYAVVRDVGDRVLTRRAQAATQGRLEIAFADGRLPVINTAAGAGPDSSVPSDAGHKDGNAAAKPRKSRPAKPRTPPEQGNLF